MAADSMCPEVWIAPPVTFIVNFRFWFLGGMALQLALEGFNLPLQLADCLLNFRHGGVLGSHVIGVFHHLHFQVHVGAGEVSHFCPVLRCCLCKVHQILLCSDQVVGSVAALMPGLLLLSEV